MSEDPPNPGERGTTRTDDHLGDCAVLLDREEAHVAVQLDSKTVIVEGDVEKAVSVVQPDLSDPASDLHLAVEFERVDRFGLFVLELLLQALELPLQAVHLLFELRVGLHRREAGLPHAGHLGFVGLGRRVR